MMNNWDDFTVKEAIPDAADLEAIEVGLLRMLVGRQRFASATAWLGFSFLAWLMRDAVVRNSLWLWVGSLVLMELLNLSLLNRLQAVLGDARRRGLWLKVLTVQFYVYGAVWGSATVLPGLSHDHAVLQTVLVGTVTVALFGMYNLIAYRPMLVAFCLGVASPLLIAGVWDESQTLWVISAAFLVPFIKLYGRASHHTIRHNIHGTVMTRKLALQLKQRNQELSDALEKVQLLATRDPLTQCLNRRALLEALQQELQRMKRNPTVVGLVMFDLDHFKSINDTHGHGVGDAVLVAAAARVKAHLRESDLLARWGGEEFVCVLRQVQLDSLVAKAQALCVHLAATPLVHNPLELTVSASFGIALWTPDESVESCIHRADEALYRAKRAGRNRVST